MRKGDTKEKAEKRAVQQRGAMLGGYQFMRKSRTNWIGSESPAIDDIQRELPLLIAKYDIQTVTDIGCGDAEWMDACLPAKTKYTGCDINPELVANNAYDIKGNRKFQVLDVLTDPVPQADLVICRDMLNHMSIEDVWIALHAIKASGSKFLLVTTFRSTTENPETDPKVIYNRRVRHVRWNFEIEPFHLRMLCKIKETWHMCRGRDLILVNAHRIPD
jgi:hypothetical protein